MSFLSKIFGPKTEPAKATPPLQKADINKIVCPYCFETFAHHEVHFRVSSNSIKSGVLSDDDLIDTYGDDAEKLQQERQKAKMARRFQRQESDSRLTSFWKDRFNVDPSQRDDKEWNNPVITPEDDDMLFHGDPREGREFSNDTTQPFLSTLRDYYGNPATIRLCPKCHNVLSSTYGKYPVTFISVVGITGSGKTVYLNQLIDNLQTTLSRAGLSVTAPFNMRSIDRIQKGKFLPMSTQESIMYPPMMINIEPVKNGVKQKRTLVFYDIAGENCTSQQKLAVFGRYLEKSEAIILLMDPKQFILFNDSHNSVNPANVVVDALVNFFSSKREKPLMAATLSKSDTLKKLADDFLMSDIIRKDSVIFQKINWQQTAKGFYMTSYNLMSGAMNALRQHIDPASSLDNPLVNEFKARAYFAVSALGVEVQAMYNITGDEKKPHYIETPNEAANAIEMLLQKDNMEEPPLYNGKREVYIGKNLDTNEDVVMSFEEIKENKTPVRYLMKNDPNPCRIEEPLLWILYKLNIIEGVNA